MSWLICLLACLCSAPGPARADTGSKAAGASSAAPASPSPHPSPHSSVRALGDAFRALEAQDFESAYRMAARIDRKRLLNRDYALYVMAQSAFFLGRYRAALEHFRELNQTAGSRFRELARWRAADCEWQLGQHADAANAYRALLAQAEQQSSPAGDVGVARFRIAEAQAARPGGKRRAIADLQAFLRLHPAHPLASKAEKRLFQLGGERAARLSARDRLARAQTLTGGRRWHEAIAELAQIGDGESREIWLERDYWTSMTLFKMRRRYGDAGETLVRIYKDLGDRAAEALFHGARALSRADRDAEAIAWYQRVVAEFPATPWAAEAQFLTGWLFFNLGDYKAAIPRLETMLARYGKTKWADDAVWFLGFSHYLSGAYDKALPHFESLGRQRDALVGGQGRYWHARALQQLGKRDEANRGYRELVGLYPFSWYAHLARARLAEQGIRIGPFGDQPRDPDKAPALATSADAALAADPLIRTTDELVAAGLTREAGVELHRGEREFLGRHERSAALAMLMDRYRRADNFHRPWMLAVIHSGRALDSEPKGKARIWWEHAYPLAYRSLVDKWRHLGKSPTYYLYAIMRKESGFDPHVVSYADARGLLQMIPPTTRRVLRQLGAEYTEDVLFEPELNIKSGSWYVGRLLQKFKGQVPIGAGAFNCGPRPVMRWLDINGQRPVDEFVELVSYEQTRGYMKKVTEAYSRYLYLYEGTVYEQPLTVDARYIVNDLTY